ncbi:MAG: endonuclease/exonuclease/phosphatase family protein [Actinomycetota bacterium]|nr:endonuclease/exonuclease/phosphatase family protein [Actinomycetota bacterium]
MTAHRSRLRVATFNLHHCEGIDGKVDPGRAARSVVSLEADVIALQEIDRGLPRSDRVDQVAQLQQTTGHRFSFHATVQRAGGRYGIALGAREELDVEAVELFTPSGLEPRAALVAEVSGVTVVATHLSRMKHRDVQERQLDTLAAIVTSSGGPLVMVGDLNRDAGDLGALASSGLVPAATAPTFPARAPKRQLDHILVSEGVEVDSGGSLQTEASDHLPLWADVFFR